ncbi:hypothetical protein [[Eubacterium] cellulosolvens]
MTGIPKEIAIKICEKIQNEREKKIYMVGQMQCVACLKSSKGDPDKMCFSSDKDNRGCIYINKRFDNGKL